MVSDGVVDGSDHPVQLSPPIDQHSALELKCLRTVVVRAGDDLLNLLEREVQLAEKKDLLKRLQVGIRV
ncbi:hypothetical protein D3C73_1520030 [compost metagenome]